MIYSFKNIIIYISSKFYSDVLVKNLFEISLMGNLFDRTIDHYTNTFKAEGHGEGYLLEFYLNQKEYIVPCKNFTDYSNALKYLKEDFTNQEDRLMYALEMKDGKYFDITENVRKFYGPRNDFYNGESFHVKRSDITESSLYIIDDKLDIHVFSNESDNVIIF